jgi:tRNA dimethylallyltransferase
MAFKTKTGVPVAAAEGPIGPVVIVTGPTASGKSELALGLAETFDGVVINADSMQVYRELAVLTARPDLAAMRRVSHRLYGVLPGAERCSAGRWRVMALAEIAAAHADGKLPIVAGGTGLYLRALVEGLGPAPEVPEATRAEAKALHRDLGGEEFHALLAVRDPAMATRLHPNDTQRLLRAWEVMAASRRSLAEWQAQGQAGGCGSDSAKTPALQVFWLISEPVRRDLYAACDARFLAMIQGGALDEVRALNALGLDPALPIMKALGVRELSAHLSGELSLEDGAAKAQQATRNYAKRQMTWMRTQLPSLVRDPAMRFAQFSESLHASIFSEIRRFLLTR